jgi:hypothetical protein
MQMSEPKFTEFKNFQNNSENSGQICTEWCEPCQALCSQGFGGGKKRTGKQNGLLPREMRRWKRNFQKLT